MIQVPLRISTDVNLTVTTTATNYYTLVDSASGLSNAQTFYDDQNANAVLIHAEGGDIRYIVDDSGSADPTADDGTLIKKGEKNYIPGIELSKLKLISVSGSVKVTVVPYNSELAESPAFMSATGDIESNGGQSVNIQDQTSPAFDLYFVQAIGAPTTLLNDATKDTYTIDVTDTTNFTAGTYVAVFNPNSAEFTFANQVGAPVGNTITLDTPLCCNYTAGDTVLASTREMNVDGSATRQIFQIGPFSQQAIPYGIDITRIMLYIEDDGTATDYPDDSKFGNITGGITTGCVLRRNDGTITNYYNIKTNGELANLCYDLTYTPQGKNGNYGVRSRYSFGGQDKHGVTIRLNAGDTLEYIIQDDLTNLEKFRVIAVGHLVQN